jgi:hypothetical protein
MYMYNRLALHSALAPVLSTHVAVHCGALHHRVAAEEKNPDHKFSNPTCHGSSNRHSYTMGAGPSKPATDSVQHVFTE